MFLEAVVGGEVEEADFWFFGGDFGGDGAAFEMGLRVTETGTGDGSLLFPVVMSFSWMWRTQEVSLSGSWGARAAARDSSLSSWEAESESPRS